MRPVSLLGIQMEHMGWGLYKFNIFTIFPHSPLSLRRLHCRADYVGSGRKLMDLPKINNFFTIFHSLSMRPLAAKWNLSEMAANG